MTDTTKRIGIKLLQLIGASFCFCLAFIICIAIAVPEENHLPYKLEQVLGMLGAIPWAAACGVLLGGKDDN